MHLAHAPGALREHDVSEPARHYRALGGTVRPNARSAWLFDTATGVALSQYARRARRLTMRRPTSGKWPRTGAIADEKDVSPAKTEKGCSTPVEFATISTISPSAFSKATVVTVSRPRSPKRCAPRRGGCIWRTGPTARTQASCTSSDLPIGLDQEAGIQQAQLVVGALIGFVEGLRCHGDPET